MTERPDFKLPAKLCCYRSETDQIVDIRTGRQVDDWKRDGYQYATDWFAVKVKELQDWLNLNADARRVAVSPTSTVVELVFVQLIAEGRVMGGFAI